MQITRRGFRKATSVYAAITGLGGDTFIIDDPLKQVDAQSDLQRNHLNEWFSNHFALALMTRFSPSLLGVAQVVQPETILRWHCTGRFFLTLEIASARLRASMGSACPSVLAAGAARFP